LATSARVVGWLEDDRLYGWRWENVLGCRADLSVQDGNLTLDVSSAAGQEQLQWSGPHVATRGCSGRLFPVRAGRSSGTPGARDLEGQNRRRALTAVEAFRSGGRPSGLRRFDRGRVIAGASPPGGVFRGYERRARSELTAANSWLPLARPSGYEP
jgi:hypothetical protein